MNKFEFKKKLNDARRASELGKFIEAISIYQDIVINNPELWWVLVEVYRLEINQIRSNSTKIDSLGVVLTTPDYGGNSYQDNMYSRSSEYNVEIIKSNALPDSGRLFEFFAQKKRVVIHQQWLKEIYYHETNPAIAFNKAKLHISRLKAMKAFGAKVCWTVHNLLDHDSNDFQIDICKYLMLNMCALSDVVFVHSSGAINDLRKLLNDNLSETNFYKLDHPRYDDLERINDYVLPKEVDTNLLKKFDKILLFMGMIRPYKGVSELISAYNKLLKDQRCNNVHLIVAGRMMDSVAKEALNQLKLTHPDLITVVARHLSNNEMVALLKISNLMIAPYRAILTSGTYYASSTFSVPMLAPERGFFPEIINDNVDGFLYDGSPESLFEKLNRVVLMSASNLSAIGHSAFRKNIHNSVTSFSGKFFRIMGF